ncbi:MAG TPA: hypothetical protein VKA54_17800 [Gemmatimonadaceae bacterium]|nr:hypothetical protein [Gemmatimonadaceae bacterium]
MSLAAVALLAQLAAPMTSTPPVLAFPEPGLDDSAAYAGYRTRLFRDAASNTVQIYVDARAQRVVHLLADAEDESIGFTVRGAGGHAAALRWADDSARIGRAGRSRVLEHALIADEPSVAIGWFLLGSMRVERDLQYAGRQRAAFAEAPMVIPEIGALLRAVASLEPSERARHLTLLHATSVDELRARGRPTVGVRTEGDTLVGRVTQPALDGADTLVLELRADARLVTMDAAGDSLRLRATDGRRVPFRVRLVTTGGTLTPLTRDQIFAPEFLEYARTARADGARPGAPRAVAMRALRLERQMRGLELLASREKLMAGLPTYATYFGRDMLMSALMMQPIWRPEMSEFVIASALRKLSPGGRVSHEEALGGQAVREAAGEYAAIVRSAGALAPGAARDSALGQARTVLRDLRRVRENYHMIDAEFQLPILEARWLSDTRVPASRKREFLLDTADGAPRIVRMLRELALLAQLTAPYARNPVPANLVSFAPRDSGRWASQSWRDSEVGYAGGRYAMDVNAIWAPRALDAMSRVLTALRSIGLLSDAVVRNAAASGDTSVLARYVRDPDALRAAVQQWRSAERHFVVRLSAEEARERIERRLAALPDAERRHWTAVLATMRADAGPVDFLALSLDASGRPIGVANSDVATRLFLGEVDGEPRTPDASERAAVLRDVRTFARRYPVGLLVDGVGPVVANDAYAAPVVWPSFERDRYHGPRVVWGRENNLFLLGATRRMQDAARASAREAGELSAYRRELASAIERVGSAVEASGFHSELWSYELRDGRIVPVRYGSGSDVQLWSTTDLAVGFARRVRR